MVLESTIDEEINEIRRELVRLAGNVSATSPSLSVASAVEQTPFLEIDGDSDDAGLQHLMRLLLQEREKSEDARAMSVGALEAKREELTRLTHERDELRDWLHRGLAECRRVAGRAQRLENELAESTHRCQLIESEKEDMEKKVGATQRQLEDAKRELELLQEKTQLLGASAEQRALMAQQLEEMHAQRQKEYETLARETSFLRRRVEKVGETEMYVQLLAERLEQLQGHIERVGCALRKGNIGDVPSKEFFLPESLAGPQQPLGELLVRVKIILQSLPDAVQRLQDDINAFVAEQRVLRSEQAATQRARIEAVHLEKQAELHKYELEREAMVREISRLRAEFMRHVTNGGEDCGEEDVEQQEKCAAAFESLVESNTQLVDENNKLREENSLLREKMRRLKIDWKKVHESQLRFEDLQLRVDMIQQINEKLRVENNSLRLFIETHNQEEEEGEQRPSPEKVGWRHYLEMNGETTGRHGALGESSGKRYAGKSSSAPQDISRHGIERELFQEWKNMVISGSFD